MQIVNPYQSQMGQPSPYTASNLGFGSQQSSNPYAQMYANWVNQQMAPYMGQQQVAPNQLQQLQAQIAALQNQMAPMQNDMLSSQWRSGGNP